MVRGPAHKHKPAVNPCARRLLRVNKEKRVPVWKSLMLERAGTLDKGSP